ncbi:MAG: hypothetical protein ACYCS8_03980 [Acidithiobacillus sp.]
MISDYTLSVLDECDKDTLHRICDELLQLREEKRQAVQARAKTLRHDEITEPGYYMVKYHNSTMIVEEITQGDIEDGDIDPGAKYIGPLKWPEVQG